MCAIVIFFPGVVTSFVSKVHLGSPSTIDIQMPAPEPDEGAPAQINIP